MTKPCYIFDIDGTISDHSHRLPLIHPDRPTGKDWPAFHEACVHDTPINPMCQVARALIMDRTPVIFITGRTERQRRVTQEWLSVHLDYGTPNTFRQLHEGTPPCLSMRGDDDFREATVVKGAILDLILKTGLFEPVMAFEDDPKVCAMWRSRGLVVAQIGEWQGVPANPAEVYAR